jgi:hypothetical protein
VSAINDGGPAFPASPTYGPNGDLYRPADIGCEGMTLRDWFAGQALAGQLASMSSAAAVAHIRAEDAPKLCSIFAYIFADAMLAARKGGSND